MSKSKSPEVNDLFRSLRTEGADKFLAAPIDLNAVGEYGRTLLHEAIAFHKIEIAEALVARGVAVNAQDSKGQTALHYAATFGRPDLARHILETGGDPNIVDKFGNNPLWTAAVAPKKDYALVKLLADHGADPRHKNNAGRSVLDFAKQSENRQLWLACGGKEDEF
jgi:uncharacterized protein